MPAHEITVPDSALYIAIDLGSTRWQLAMTTRSAPKVRRRSVEARDVMRLLEEVALARERLTVPGDAEVRVCHEAGRDGFWLQRWLEERGYVSLIIDPGSVEISGRKRRAKTDRLDAELLLRSLLRWHTGDRHTFRPVRVPSRLSEDARLLHRRRQARLKDRIRHGSRISSLLATRGIKLAARELRRLESILDTLHGADGRALSAPVKAAILQELELLRLCETQIRALDRQMTEAVTSPSDKATEQVAHLVGLCGLGVTSAWVLVHELFGWRTFRNRRELAAAAGLVPTPYQSDQTRRDQGISKAGNRRIRAMMNQLAWLWLRHQPESALTHWYMTRWGTGSKRQRRIGIVALSRKLLIALWRFIESGLVPSGARMRSCAASSEN